MTTPANPRKAAQERVTELIDFVQQQPASDERATLLNECEALARAIGAFHMEGIRFRAFNVDRLLQKGAPPLPPAASEAFAQMRRHLDEAGFHTRSHQSPV
ncbi:MAG: hypothetical protein H0W08_21400 [Acidobacteria bacterium]|nr:hypothetical protein [Acidobacteriota bacterium]